MKSYLITGGSGFIGTHLIKFLLADDSTKEIVNIDLRQSKIKDSRLHTFITDIRSVEQLKSLKMERKLDVCIHLAALCKEPGFEWEEYFETNHLGTQNIILLCKNWEIHTIAFTSTMMVYPTEEQMHTEESMTAPNTAYGISKLLAEKELEIWQQGKANRFLKMIRPAVVFGENENANFTRLCKSLRKGFFPYIGKKSTVKSNIYVKELILFISFLIKNRDNPQQVFNFCFPERHEMRIIIKNFNHVFDFKPFTPILPYKLMLYIAYIFEFLKKIGIKNEIHHRRIQKLYYSTYIYPQKALSIGYKFTFDLKKALLDWKNIDFTLKKFK